MNCTFVGIGVFNENNTNRIDRPYLEDYYFEKDVQYLQNIANAVEETMNIGIFPFEFPLIIHMLINTTIEIMKRDI